MTVNIKLSKIISFVTSKGFQIHPDALTLIDEFQEDIFKVIDKILSAKKGKEKSRVILSEDIQNFVKPSYNGVEIKRNDHKDQKNVSRIADYTNHRKMKMNENKDRIINSSITTELFEPHNEDIIIYNSDNNVNSGEGVEGYTSLFRSRYEKSLKILSLRPDSRRIKKVEIIKQLFNQSKINTNSMSREQSDNTSSASSSIFVAGLIMEKTIKKNSYNVTIDDQTGLLEATAYDEELRKQISLLTLDQMVMIELDNNSKRRNHVIKNIFSIDIPDRIPNRSRSEVYSVLISDLHIGSKFFMEKEFERFLDWLNGKKENKEIISKIKYVCICGDLIDGIGIFPNQDKELLEKDSYSQMEHAINILSRIPKHMKIFLIPGNHDLGRRALPQPAIPRKYSEKLYSLDNVTMLGNPCMINMQGVKTLMFHGQSLDDIIATIPGLSYSKPAEAMKILLKSRHLSPIYGHRTPLAPEKEDMMVIEEVPDILHSGHVHVIDVDSYKGTLVVNSGAWQTQTPFQRTMGITPTPGIAIVINLSDLKPYQINFAIE